MAETTASLKISVDSRDVKNAKTDLDNLSKSSSNAEKSTTSLSSTLKVSLAASAALAATALYKAASAGVTFNKSMEDSAAGLSALTVATSSNISAMGKHLSITEKYNLAIAESKKTVQQLNAINAETPHSLEETTKIYKSMYASMKNAGASNEQMIHLTKQLSIAAGSAGIEINSLLSGVDGLANGTVESASDFGRFMSSLGLTNEELKKSTNVVELLQSKLGEFKVLDTMTVAVSNFDNAWSQLAGTLTKDIFSSAKDDINTFTAFLVKANDKLSDYKANIENISDIHKIDSADVAIRELTQLVAKYDDLKESGVGLFQSAENYNAQLKNQEFLINSLTKKLERLQETKDTLIAKEKEPTLTYEKWLKDEEKKALKTKSNAELAKDFEKRKQEEDKKNESKKEEAAKKAIKAEEDRLKKSHEIAQSQLKMIQEESDKKIKLQEDYQNTLNDIVQKNDSEKLDGLAKEAFDTFAHYDSLIEKYKEVAGAESALRAMQTMAIDTIIDKQKELDEAYNNKAAIDSLDEIYGRYEKLIDAQIELAENGMNIDFDFGDGAKELNNISKAMQQLHVGSMKFAKQDIKLQEDFAKNFLEAKGDELKEKEIVANFDADNAKLKETQHNAELAAYSNLAGAMVGAFEKGSAGAIAFTTLQSALGIASSWAAIAEAWALPFPSNIPAVAMVSSAVLPIIAQLGGSGGGGGGGSTPSITEANKAKIEDTYNPILDRLDRQIELLEAIDKQGSAAKAGISVAQNTFNRDYALFVEDTLENVQAGFDLRVVAWQGYSVADMLETFDRLNATLGSEVFAQNLNYDYEASNTDIANVAQSGGDSARVRLDLDYLREGFNMLSYIAAAYGDLNAQIPLVESIHNNRGTPVQTASTTYGETLNAVLELTNEYALSMVETVNELKEASETFEESFDSITGTMFYETQRLTTAFSDFDRLRGESSYADYLQTQVTNIRALEAELDTDMVELLLSNDPSRIAEQIEAINALSVAAGESFEGGAEEALNYLESIELVAESMASSRDNIKEWTDNFKSEFELMADSFSNINPKGMQDVESFVRSFYEIGLNRTPVDSEVSFWTDAVSNGAVAIENLFSTMRTAATSHSENMSYYAESLDELDKLFLLFSKDIDGLTDNEMTALQESFRLIDGAIDSIDSKYQQYSPSTDKSFSDVDKMLKDVNLTNYDKILEMIDSAYEVEKSNIEEKFELEKKVINQQIKSVQDLAKFAEDLRYDNQTESARYASSGRLLEIAVVEFRELLKTGVDTSEALSNITKYSKDYLSYAKMYSKNDAEYNYAVSSLQNKLKEVVSTPDLNNKGLSERLEAKLSESDVLLKQALDGLGLVTLAKLDEVKNNFTTENVSLDIKELNTTMFGQLEQLGGLLGEDNYTVKSLENLKGTLVESITGSAVDVDAIISAGEMDTSFLATKYEEFTNTLGESLGLDFGTSISSIDTTSQQDALVSLGEETVTAINTIDIPDVDLSLIDFSSVTSAIGAIEIPTTDLSQIDFSSVTSAVDSIEIPENDLSQIDLSSVTSAINSIVIPPFPDESYDIQLDAILDETKNEISILQNIASGIVDIANNILLVSDMKLMMINGISSTIGGIGQLLIHQIDKQVFAMTESNNIGFSGLYSKVDEVTEAISNLSTDVTNAIYYGDKISSAYGNILGRTPERQGIEYWTERLSRGDFKKDTDFYESITQGGIYNKEIKSNNEVKVIVDLSSIQKELSELRQELQAIKTNSATIATNTKTSRVVA